MSKSFYIRRYLLAFAIAASVISFAQWLKGHGVNFAIREGLIWGAISSAVYTSVLARKLRKCAVPAKDQDLGGGS